MRHGAFDIEIPKKERIQFVVEGALSAQRVSIASVVIIIAHMC
jgi:hypothetical protein